MNTIENPALYKIWEDRYCKNGETLEQNYRRVAHFVAQNYPEDEEEFYNVISNGYFLPAGRTMSNAGLGGKLGLNNCFVAPQVQDDLTKIFETVTLGAVTHKSGGGIGYDFSCLRPHGTPTSNDAVASGPVSFIEVFNAQTEVILQGNRRGANMGIMNIYHPDIYDFINVKSEKGKLERFNLSVMVDDDFMNAVEEDKEIFLHFPVYDEKSHVIKDPSKWKISKKVSAKELWNEIMQKAYDTGEPGVFFYDNMNKDNNLSYAETIVCTNPCSEYLAGTLINVPDPENYGGACNLGSLILPKFVKKPFTKDAKIDFDLLRNTIFTAVKMLDNIIDINTFPSKIFENYQKKFRTIGLGVTGLADLLVMLGYKYDSQEGINITDKLMNCISYTAYTASVLLSIDRGSFPGYNDKFLKGGYLTKHTSEEWEELKKLIYENGIRNAKILSVAPAGTMSLTFGNNCSSGIEPIFSLEYDRKIKYGGQSEADTKIVTIRDYAYDCWIKKKDDLDCCVKEDVFSTALNIPVQNHIDMLATIAAHVDMSVSKTINIPTDYSFEQTKEVYTKCWKSGIKGCTIFRPNVVREGILIDKNSKKVEEIQEQLSRGDIIECSNDLIGMKRKLTSGCGSLHVLAYFDPTTKKMMEVYLSKGSTGGCGNSLVGLSRTISLLLRAGVDVYTIKDQLDSTGSCPSYAVRSATKHDTSKGSCCPMAIGNALVEMYEEFQEDKIEESPKKKHKKNKVKVSKLPEKIRSQSSDVCPECGSALQHVGGCINCTSCGWSKCN